MKTTGGIEEFNRRRIGNVVTKTKTGSAINAYSRNRTQKRTIESTWNGHHPQTVVEPVEQGGDLNNSSIALFGCEPGEALDLIGRLEQVEGLPHPERDGKWLKKLPYATSSKIICGINPHDFDETIAMCKEAGITCLYTMGGYKSWGHFEPAVPGGFKQLREMAEKAKAQGIILGAHSLTTFIHPHDPYVTPVPDKRLAVHALTTLSSDIDETTTEIPIGKMNLDIYSQKQNIQREGLYVIRIDDELIQFGPLSKGQTMALDQVCSWIRRHKKPPVTRPKRPSPNSVPTATRSFWRIPG